MEVWSIDSVESEVWERANDDDLEMCDDGLHSPVTAGKSTLPVETSTSLCLCKTLVAEQC